VALTRGIGAGSAGEAGEHASRNASLAKRGTCCWYRPIAELCRLRPRRRRCAPPRLRRVCGLAAEPRTQGWTERTRTIKGVVRGHPRDIGQVVPDGGPCAPEWVLDVMPCGYPQHPSVTVRTGSSFDESEWFALGFDARWPVAIVLNASSHTSALACASGYSGARPGTTEIQLRGFSCLVHSSGVHSPVACC
jgi:hypothetical protein